MNERQQTSISRRSFLQKTAGAGAGLTLAVYLSGCSREEPASTPPASATGAATAVEPLVANAFVKIGTDNRVTVVIKHLEMGQGVYTGLATLVAEEMDADWGQIVAASAPADATRYANLHWGPVQGTGGSSAIANAYLQMREAGAAARQMLIGAAATAWEVPAGEIEVARGQVSHRQSGRQASFGELAEAAVRQPVPENVTLKDPAAFTLIGRHLSRKDVGKVDGSAIFTQDIQLDGMLTAVVAHPPVFGARLKGFDDSAARQVKGVVNVVQVPTGVAVLADTFWHAKRGRDALQLEWDDSEAFTRSSADLMMQYKELAKQPGAPARVEGDVEKGFAGAAKVLEASYEFPFLAHATMEPMNCVARITGKGAEIWNGCQLQTGDQMAVAAALGCRPEDIIIHTLLAGGSFGRRASGDADYVIEAVEIAKAHGRDVPVKLVWTREDDTRAGYFRPLYFHHLKAGLDQDGKVVAWQHRIVGQSILDGTPFSGMIRDGIDLSSVEGALHLPYHIDNFSLELHTVDVGVPVLWWRSVGSTHTAYATETFIDELAAAAGRDPVAFRLQMLGEDPRYEAVLKLAAERGGWQSPLPEGRARGFAVHKSFGSYVAQLAEVSIAADGGYRVDKVTCAVDCGVAVNPDVIRAQMEGGIGYGLSPTLISETTLEQGQVVEANFDRYQVVRMEHMPAVEVHIVPSAEAPTGVGEPGTPVIGPAVANALFAASGKPRHRLPLGMKV
ncbi:xanthine dehydrogenase family protein molybdopterin-binding subunit [Exilibacterium tricleocarpae]|uniref:Xanthine dehydrogenase family protein molybdopterin-binding subunit n=1 Tax=Exilibacterium tricleocarpae TaxID=2591008 RepID=A0A545SYW5_9GAMM|nr:xanthine dehydrogenase family protein molybdopterin-binding subunit [Exilibacterium tricleocarpae]TQV70165.1 xanthine dehydrogenase family protein molybdopterin-binding subunit [Exilibacterium tricleocarpae]